MHGVPLGVRPENREFSHSLWCALITREWCGMKESPSRQLEGLNWLWSLARPYLCMILCTWPIVSKYLLNEKPKMAYGDAVIFFSFSFFKEFLVTPGSYSCKNTGCLSALGWGMDIWHSLFFQHLNHSLIKWVTLILGTENTSNSLSKHPLQLCHKVHQSDSPILEP